MRPPTLRLTLRLRPLAQRPYSTTSSPLEITTLPAPHTGTIQILTLARPAARNAISRALLSSLSSAITSLPATTRAVVLASSSDPFCAGADLKERLGMTPAETSAFLTSLRATFAALAALPIPTIAAVAGPALGGGLELALCTHMRVFASTATVGLPETRLGIIPGAGGTFRLPAVVGQARAREMILTGRRVTGAEAYFLGLCDRLVEVEEGKAREMVLDAAVGMAKEICEGGPVAIQAAMEAVDGCALGEESENRAYEKVLKTEDRMEALKAFREKRKPEFKGR